MNQIKDNSHSELFINGSKFYCYGFQVNNKIEADKIILKLRNDNKKAVHVCFGMIIKEQEKLIYYFDDDGEPKNSAGKRILGSLIDNNITNSLLVVVRYKSRSMLGLGLLTRSYYNVCDQLIKNNNIIKYQEFKKVFIEYYCPKHLNLIFNLLNSYESKNIECLNNQISALVSLEKSKEIQEKVINLEKIYKKSKKF